MHCISQHQHPAHLCSTPPKNNTTTTLPLRSASDPRAIPAHNHCPTSWTAAYTAHTQAMQVSSASAWHQGCGRRDGSGCGMRGAVGVARQACARAARAAGRRRTLAVHALLKPVSCGPICRQHPRPQWTPPAPFAARNSCHHSWNVPGWPQTQRATCNPVPGPRPDTTHPHTHTHTPTGRGRGRELAPDH
jgi:hypothetical protein